MVQCYRPPGRDGVASVFALLVQPTPAMREDPPFLAHNSSAAGADIGLPKMLARYPTLIPVAWPTAMWRRVRLSLHPFSTNSGCSRVSAYGEQKILWNRLPQSCRSIGGAPSALLTLAAGKSETGLQRKESVASARFLATQLHELEFRSAAVRGGQLGAHCSH